MKRKTNLLLILSVAPALSGCALQAALAAAELAQYVPRGEERSNAHLEPVARETCSARAAQHGTVHIIDVEQRRPDLMVVWGSVTNPQQPRRSFECHFTSSVRSFKVRDIKGG